MGTVEQWRLGPGPSVPASSIYGFTTEAELGFLRWFLATQYTGEGAVVELGCALGRSTLAMLEGLAANAAAASTRLFVYDIFEFDWWLLEQYREQSGAPAGSLTEGGSFLEIFRSNLRRYEERLEIRPGDVTAGKWSDGSIGFLFVDIMKSWSITRAVIEKFFPSLIPGRSLLVHQDYKHPFAPQILLTMYRLRDHFEPAWSVCGSGVSATVAFRCVREIGRDEIAAALEAGLCDLRSYTIGEIEAALDHALAIVAADPEADLVRAARTVIYADLLAERPEYSIPAAKEELVRRLVRERARPYLVEGDAALEQSRWAAEIASLRATGDRLAAELSATDRGRREVQERLDAVMGSRRYRLAEALAKLARPFRR
ncbi:MAG: class I SAM-dependent methyltransferase [Thermoanaerobaculia bacterium]